MLQGSMDEHDARPGNTDAELMVVGPQTEGRAAATSARRRATARRPRSAQGKLLGGALLSVLIMLVALIAIPAAAGKVWQTCPSAGASPADIQRIEGLVEAELQAFVTGDTARLGRILAPDAVLITPSGDEWSRADLIEAMTTRTIEFQAFRPRSRIDVRLDCTVAYVTYRSHIDVAFAGERWRHAARHIDVYERRDDQWLVVRSQTTAVGGFPTAGR